jgi:tetratricopeptide (TPR) repeat protein
MKRMDPRLVLGLGTSIAGWRRAAAGFAAVMLGAACAGPAESGAAERPAADPASIDSLAGEGRWRAALAEIDAALVVAPDEPGLLSQRVGWLRRLGREREALETARKLCELAPRDAGAAYEAGELEAHLGDFDRARERFETAQALAPDDWRPAIALAALSLREDPPRIEDAEARLAPWLEGESARAEARFHLAVAKELRTEGGAAAGGAAAIADSDLIAAFERALEIDPRHLPSLCNAARIAERSGEEQRALALLRRARDLVVESDPRLARAIEQRIEALEEASPGGERGR